MSERRGRCLCGTVTITTEVTGEIQACHCVQCQRWTGGGPLFSARASNTRIEGRCLFPPTLSISAKSLRRRVCGTCGSTLWWKMQDRPADYVAVGLLDDQTGLTVTEEIFVDYRPGWLPPFPGASQSTEAEEVAKFDAWMAKQGKSVE